MPRVLRACQMFPNFAWTFKFPKFSVLERNCINWRSYKNTNFERLNKFTCIRMCDHSVCISPHYTTSLHTVFCFSTPSSRSVRNYFIVFEMYQEIPTMYVHLLLQFEPNGSYFTTSFLLHCESRKQQFRLSPIFEG